MAVWPLLALAMLLGVIVLSYRIEKRSPDSRTHTGIPRYAMLFPIIPNRKVARDRRTQTMRWIMLALLAGIAGLFVAVALVVGMIERTPR